MGYVYILSSYDEYGSENLVATLERDKLVGLLEAGWGATMTDLMPAMRVVLRGLLGQADEDLAAQPGPRYLTGGWGGVTLHVVPLS